MNKLINIVFFLTVLMFIFKMTKFLSAYFYEIYTDRLEKKLIQSEFKMQDILQNSECLYKEKTGFGHLYPVSLRDGKSFTTIQSLYYTLQKGNYYLSQEIEDGHIFLDGVVVYKNEKGETEYYEIELIPENFENRASRRRSTIKCI